MRGRTLPLRCSCSQLRWLQAISQRVARCASIRWWRCATNNFKKIRGNLAESSGLLLEKTAEGVYGIVWILLLRFSRSSAARTSQLRLEHSGGNSADVGHKFRISGCAVDLKRNRGALAAALASTDRA